MIGNVAQQPATLPACVAFALVVDGLALCIGGCTSNACENNLTCPPDGSVDGQSGDAPANCDVAKDPKDAPTCVVDGFGIFVDATNGKDSNTGTKEAPVQTMAHALDTAKSQNVTRVYVCEGTYAEDLVLDTAHDGISLYGGWKCSDWSYSGTRPVVGKSQLAAKLDSLSKTIAIQDLEFDAIDGDTTNLSSVAMAVRSSSNVALARVKLAAAKGHSGAAGTLTNFSFPAQAALNGDNADAGTGGAANAVVCPAGDTTTGGKGGDNGNQGSPGLPALDGGAGGMLAACNSGGGGGDGASPGSAKDGAGAKTVGTFVSGVWTPEKGLGGGNGGCGQGGGGGLGFGNGGGGGGGAGGCGGAGGGGGTGGGASVALAIDSSAVALTNSVIVTSTAGNGGAGVAGQPGETTVGNGGLPTGGGCMGGKGGIGGAGGAGGGGAGGVSAGVLWKGTSAPTIDSATQSSITTGTKGNKGAGGSSGTNDGIDGVAQAVLQAP